MQQPTITISIATFNSAAILEKVLKSIKCQKYPKELIKILLVDGGSTDSTLELGKKYNCEVLLNTQTEPVNAKFLAYKNCDTQYLMFLDHDEVLYSQNSLQKKVNLFDSNEKIKAIASTGYKNPDQYPFINDYINEFGDPFSCFIYRLSKSYIFFIKTMKKRYNKNYQENDQGLFFDFKNIEILPIIEVCAGGGIIDVDFFKKKIPLTLEKKEFIPHFFYYMIEKGGLLGITKDDYIIHYSADNLKKYFNKIKWRIKNNIFHSEMGQSGFTGRNHFQKNLFVRYKKFLFIPYSLLILPCLIDSIRLVMTRKNVRFIIHLPLCLYTSILIAFFYFLKITGYKENLRSYDNRKEIK